MDNKFALNLPLNPVSFGQVSTSLCREVQKLGLKPAFFPIGNIDLSTQKPDNDFNQWVQESINRSQKTHSRKNTVAKLWHLNGLMESYSENQVGITFLETDSVSETEANIVRNQKTLFVTSNYTKRIMEDIGLTNVKYLPLGFDSYNFYDTKKKYFDDGRIVISVVGKLEVLRKRHGKIISALTKKYGNNREIAIHLLTYNVFLKPEDNQGMLNQILGGNRYFNINAFPFLKTNAEYNDAINATNIIIGMSGGEGFDAPVYTATALGKYCVSLKAHAYLDYLDDENSIRISPNGKIRAVDNIFFRDNPDWNIGNFYDWSEDDFLSGVEIAIQKYKSNPINTKGLELQNRTYRDTLDILLKEL